VVNENVAVTDPAAAELVGSGAKVAVLLRVLTAGGGRVRLSVGSVI
jgi:hypothetical protein